MINEWLENRYSFNPSEELKTVLGSFTLIWNLYESKVFQTRFNINNVRNTLDGINWQQNDFQEFYDYFKDRYTNTTENGVVINFQHNSFFDGVPNNGLRELVKNTLIFTPPNLEGLETDNTVLPALDVKDIIVTCLTIVARFRNNMFHGVKTYNDLENQIQNFEVGTRLLMKVIEKGNYQ